MLHSVNPHEPSISIILDPSRQSNLKTEVEFRKCQKIDKKVKF